MDISNFYLFLYIIIWIITFVHYQDKRKYVDSEGKSTKLYDSGSIILISYIIYSVFSIVAYNIDILRSTFNDLSLFPFIYLYVMLRLAIRPVLNYNQLEFDYVKRPNQFLFVSICLIIIISTLLKVYGDFSNIQSGIFRLIYDDNAGMEMYDDSREIMANSGSTISNLAAIISNVFSDFAPLLFFYYLSLPKEKVNKFILYGLAMVVVSFLITPIVAGQRSGVVYNGFTIIVAFFALNKFIPLKIKRRVLIFSSVVLSFTAFLFTLLTISRFNYGNNDDAKYSVISYAGQQNINFNNYGLDAGGIRYGDRTANLIKRVVDPSTPKNYVERRQKYDHLKIDDYSFYTFVGDFTLDYGPSFAFLLFVVFSQLFVDYTRIKGRIMPFYKLLAVYFPMCVCMQGGLALFTYSDSAGLRMIAFLLLIILFKYTPSNAGKLRISNEILYK